MKIRSLFKMPMAVVIGILIIGGIINIADAAIVDTKDSADFTNKDFEGNSVPTGGEIVVDGVTTGFEGWTVGDGNYTIVQGGEDNMAGNNGLFSSAAGWTAEWRVKLDSGNLPTSYHLGTNRGAFGVQLADDSATATHWVSPIAGYDSSSDPDEFIVWDANTDALLHRGGDPLAFHTVRLAAEANGGDDEFNLYVDGVFAASVTGLALDLNRQWFGEEGAAVSSGTAIVDYFRVDTSGAFAPCGGAACTVPEPSTLVLLGFGLAGLFASWRRRK